MLNTMAPAGNELDMVQRAWMIDNGVFSGKWREDIWLKRLEKFIPFQRMCIGVVVPDVMFDKEGTLLRWSKYVELVYSMGYRPFFVTQNGCDREDIPVNAFGIFIGGDNKHKLEESFDLIDEAKERGLWVHVGRVNSMKRMGIFKVADSCDGTTLKFEPSINNQEKLWRASKNITKQKKEPRLWFLQD